MAKKVVSALVSEYFYTKIFEKAKEIDPAKPTISKGLKKILAEKFGEEDDAKIKEDNVQPVQ